MKLPIYLDNHATTPLDPEVLESMLPYLRDNFGNPASNHTFGWVAQEAVDQAREQVARLVSVTPDEVYFTSGATESNNLAIKGIIDASDQSIPHIITVATEHEAVLDPLKQLQAKGIAVTILPVDQSGKIDLNQLEQAIQPNTILISPMLANNEIGTIHPVNRVAEIGHARGIYVHTDAAQAVGKVPVDAGSLDADLISFTAHKIYGPKGIGALIIRKRRPRIRISPQIPGGGQENGIRSGTLNVAGIVGFGAACKKASEALSTEATRIEQLRNRLQQALLKVTGSSVNGDQNNRLPGNLNICFPGIEGESLLMGLSDIAISTGAACSSTEREPSHVLKAIGLSDEEAFASVRFGIGRFNTEEEIDYAAAKVTAEVEKLRSMRL